MRNHIKILAALAVATSPLAVQAQDPAATPAAPAAEPEQETAQRASLIFALFGAAIQAEEIPEDEKNGLIGCMYGNTLQTISRETGKLLKNNPQLDGTDQGVVYAAAATVCGARKAGDAAAEPATER